MQDSCVLTQGCFGRDAERKIFISNLRYSKCCTVIRHGCTIASARYVHAIAKESRKKIASQLDLLNWERKRLLLSYSADDLVSYRMTKGR